MIDLGFVPTSERTLQRIMKEKDAGYSIADDVWILPVASDDDKGCLGIQSKTLDNHIGDHIEYCYDMGWYMGAYGQWHAKDCSLEGIDKSGHCTKYHSIYKNLDKKYHPTLFKEPESTLASISSILPSNA